MRSSARLAGAPFASTIRWWRRVLTAAAMVAACASRPCAAPTLAGAGIGDREHTLKAGFLVNFSQFATWPAAAFAGPRSPFVIGVVGGDPFGSTLDAVVEGVDVGGRRITLRRLTTQDALRQCHVLFITASSATDVRQLLEALGGAPVLTVGDGPAFIEAGGIVAFRIENNRLRFDVNTAAAKRAGLAFSSQMLEYARLVTP